MSGDDLNLLLVRAPGTPPIRLDGGRIRADEAARRRRHRASAVGLGALAVVAAVAWRVGSSGPYAVVEQPAGRQTSPSSEWRTTTWDGLRWQVPSNWLVKDYDGPPNAAGPAYFSSGPFFGTVPTTSVCRTDASGTTSCARGNAVTQWPADGVLAWISSASVLDPTYMGPGHGMPTTDPGPGLGGIDCAGHHGIVFHSYRILASGTASARRVSLDACVFGPGTALATAQLQRITDSMAQ